ncbi:hypothetical protein [Neorhizobium sp. JUb45]|uniref:hypothetical protein n=1 Tax=unclassified Neorhizobium TaxID=2629175 RepID=UPI001046365E|nr:hypothetical protein [Neorhizobium sp. JUb45]TCR06458.1 hypothetical protein EDF70_101415 [Neorhizobium sp. JUb45]
MDTADFLTRIRNHYVDQFRAFMEQQQAACSQGASEVKLQLGEQSELFERLYCVDFIKNDGRHEIVDFQAENVLTFDPIVGTLGKTSLSIKCLQWDDVLIRHDLEGLPPDQLSHWFRFWFDPEDSRRDPNAELSETIHSMLIESNCISVDFGTANSGAFWEILQLLENAGATRIEVSSSRAETTISH